MRLQLDTLGGVLYTTREPLWRPEWGRSSVG